MNKLGFYIENTTVPFLRDALRQVKPPTILIHAGDRTLLHDIRRELSPASFVIGRLFVDLQQQTAWLDSDDPEGHARAFAERILEYDFRLATEREGDRLLIDAWMGLNEALRGPASFPNFQVDDEFRRRAEALDRFQVAFRERLLSEGLEAVAFNFAAGNFIEASHYLDWFPRTLESYIYLGFHEYGWPTLIPREGTKTAALFYRRCMEGIRQRYGDRHRVIITELGLARMYKYPHDPAGDVGWLYPGETISEEQYWESLKWYNDEICRDDYVLGCCLFEVGHTGKWETFRHLGVDNQGRPITLMSRIAKLREVPAPTPVTPPVTPPEEDDLAGLRKRIARLKVKLTSAVQYTAELPAQVTQLQQMLDDLTGKATQAANLSSQVDDLLARVNQLQAQVEQMESGDGREDVPALRERLAELKAQLISLQPEAQQASTLTTQVAQARSTLDTLSDDVEEAGALHQRLSDLLAEVEGLEAEVGPLPGEVTRPPLQDVRDTLPQHPTKRYPTRSLDEIRRIVVHHTVTRPDITPERLAQALVNRDKPGIKYHFLITGDGTIYWTQPLETAVEQTLVSAVNADGVAVALAGNFTAAVPSEAQLESAARLIAWLLSELRLGVEMVFGRSELDPRVSSPGAQWLQGARYKEALLSRVRALMGV